MNTMPPTDRQFCVQHQTMWMIRVQGPILSATRSKLLNSASDYPHSNPTLLSWLTATPTIMTETLDSGLV